MRILALSDLHLEFRAPQPLSVCGVCGEKYRLGNWNKDATWSVGQCGVCESDTEGVTSPNNCGLLGSDWNLRLPDPSTYDAVVLAGDIHSHTHAIHWAAKTFSKPVILISGNHEFYDSHLHGMSVEMRKCAQDYPHVHLLDNDSVVIDGVRFVGAVLWTDFMLHGDSMAMIGKCLHEAKLHMRDFSTIRFGSTGWMLPADSVKLFRVSAMYLRETLAHPFDALTVVVTHHLPSMRSVATRFANDLMSAAFASNLDDLVAQADVWIHGHTHDSFDYAIGKCRVVCNPRGYPTNRIRDTYENSAFDPAKIIEVGS
jgi:predicted phosphodiesterase